MSHPRPDCLLPVLLLVASLLPAGSALAAWPHDPSVNVPLCTSSGGQYDPRSAPDGAGGAIIVWWDAYNDIRAQRISASGVPLWTSDGIAVCTAAGSRERPSIAPDGAGGAVIAWQDGRNGSDDIYVQRVSANGVPLWTADGVALCTSSGNQQRPVLVQDGSGGAAVAWHDYRGSDADIYARRVASDSTPQGTAGGIALCDAAGNQTDPVIASDGRGGAIVVWTDWRSLTYTDIYARRFSATGAAEWTDDGVPVCTAFEHQGTPSLVSDAAGGAIVAWRDARSGYQIYAQRVSAPGAVQWASDGVVIGTGTGFRSNPVVAQDAAGGAIVTWYDLRGGGSDIYAQRVSSAGTSQWTSGGLALCVGTGNQAYPSMVADGAGGAIVGWYDERSGAQDIHAQRVSSGGTLLWDAAAVPVCTALGAQYGQVLVSDEAGGAILAWYDERSGYHIYGQRVDRWGYLGAEPVIGAVKDVPNDQGGWVKVSWNGSVLDTDLQYEIIGKYLVFRSAPPHLLARARVDATILERDPERAAGPPGRLLVTTHGALTYYWEYVGSQTAYHLPTYSLVAPTTGDSIAGSNPPTAFLVQAWAGDEMRWWSSAPDSGYSVDNLAPLPPAPFTGQYASGTATLHWAVNPAADLAEYRLYRGSSAGFVPGPANLVATQPDTGYVDAAGTPSYYKLCAVDIHGNASGFSTLLPSGTVDVPGAALPRAVFLAPPAPNPAHGATTLRFGLPRAARIELTLYDQQGRRVRSLLAGTLPAGERTLTWDGRDESGRALPAGLYFVRLATEGCAFVSRLAVIR